MSKVDFDATFIMFGLLAVVYYGLSYAINNRAGDGSEETNSFSLRTLGALAFAVSAPIILNLVVKAPSVMARFWEEPDRWAFDYRALSDGKLRGGVLLTLVAVIAMAYSIQSLFNVRRKKG